MYRGETNHLQDAVTTMQDLMRYNALGLKEIKEKFLTECFMGNQDGFIKQ